MTEQTQVKIVPAASLSDDEVQRLVTLINDAYARHRWLFPNPRTSVDGFLPEIGNAEVILLLVLPDSAASYKKIVGTAYVHTDDDALYFGMAAVDPNWQSRGLGGKLLETVEELARQRKLAKTRLLAAVEIGNEAYYLKRGYKTVATLDCPPGTWDALSAHKRVTMEKQVSQNLDKEG